MTTYIKTVIGFDLPGEVNDARQFQEEAIKSGKWTVVCTSSRISFEKETSYFSNLRGEQE